MQLADASGLALQLLQLVSGLCCRVLSAERLVLGGAGTAFSHTFLRTSNFRIRQFGFSVGQSISFGHELSFLEDDRGEKCYGRLICIVLLLPRIKSTKVE